MCNAMFVRVREDLSAVPYLGYSHASQMHNVWLPDMPKPPWRNPIGVATQG